MSNNSKKLFKWVQLDEVHDVEKYPDVMVQKSVRDLDNYSHKINIDEDDALYTLMNRYGVFDSGSLTSKIYIVADYKLKKALGYIGLYRGHVGEKGYYVENVFVDENSRGEGLGLFLYKSVIKDLGKLMSTTSMTPDSRKIWIKLFKDPEIEVKAYSPSEEKFYRFSEVGFKDDKLYVPGKKRNQLFFIAFDKSKS